MFLEGIVEEGTFKNYYNVFFHDLRLVQISISSYDYFDILYLFQDI